MYMRAFRTAPCDATLGAYATLSSVSSSSAGDIVPDCRLRRFVYPTFFIGIHTTTASNTNQAVAVHNMVGPEALQVSWKEIWNTLDILYDEVQLLPVKSAKAVSACLSDTGLVEGVGGEAGSVTREEIDVALSAFIAAAQEGRLAPQLAGNKKVAVCPHYFAGEAKETAALCPVLQQRAVSLAKGIATNAATATAASSAAASSGSSGGSSTTTTRVMVLDVSSVMETEKLAVELSWLTAFLLLQPGMSHRTASDGPADVLVVRLPFAEVPPMHVLEDVVATATVHQQQDRPAASTAVASAMLALIDFMGQHLSMLWEGGAGSQPPRLCFVGSSTSSTDQWVRRLPEWTRDSQRRIDLMWVSSDHVEAAVLAEQAAVLERVALTLTSQPNNNNNNSPCCQVLSTEHWKVPLQALKEGEEEEWDPYTQREMARLNFCPCCGDCDHGHGGGEGSHGGHGHGGHGHGGHGH